jgi:peptidoglycan/LPS O-acetylase OafA/YrhL
MRYRADIDGLRAVAVLAVVLFHAEVPGFGGGYVGVDVFFVISGYLITQILLADLERGQASIIRFYERRIRRIFPALFATMVFCSVAGCLLLLPQDLEQFGRSLVATTFFVSNLLFWTESGYFDAPAELKPLLHTWSLAVEEQFYILFPIYLFAISRRLPRLRGPLTLGLCVVSLVLSEWLVREVVGAFFLTPARGFELLLGACIAMGCFPPLRSAPVREALAVGGALMIGASVLLYAPETPFPGWHALVPCLGAALLIQTGSSGSPQVSRVLGLRPVVFIGLISYSLYLWHWPILVFAKYYLIRGLSPVETALLIALSILVATLSWRFIETPFRGRAPLLNRRSAFGAAGSVMAGASALGGLLIVAHGLPGRLPPEVASLAGGAADKAPDRERCNDRSAGQVERRELCTLGRSGQASPSFVVWGDSHGEALFPALEDAAAAAGRSGWLVTKAGCPSLFDVGQQRPGFSQACIDFGRAVDDLLRATPSIETVLLISRWAIYAIGERYGREKGSLVFIGTPQSRRYSLGANQQVFEDGLMRTIERLQALGKRPVIVAQVPEIGWEVPSVLARAAMFRTPLEIEPTREDYLARQRFIHRAFEAARARYGVEVVYPHEILCPQAVCEVTRAGRALYYDTNHLTLFGNGFLTGLFRAVLEEEHGGSARQAGAAQGG